jgi:hypothetical protein
MADLSDLFKVAPGMASFFTGQNQSLDQNNKQIENARLAQVLADLQQKHQQSNELHPYEVESKRMGNASALAKLPGEEAKSLSEVLKARRETQTFGSDVAAGISKNESDISKNSSDQYGRYMSDLTQFGAVLEKVPVPMRVATLKQMLGQAGYANMPSQLFEMVSADPQRMPQALREAASAMGQMKAQQTPAYHTGVDVANINRTSAEKIAKGHDATALATERMRQDGKVQAAKLRENKAKDIIGLVRTGKMSYEKAATALHIEGTLAENDDPNKKVYLELAAQMQEAGLKQKREGAPGRVDPGGMGVETVPSQEPNLGKPAGPAPAPVNRTKSGIKYKFVN